VGYLVYAERELDLYQKEHGEDPELVDGVTQLLSIFASQEHSGFSAGLTRSLFNSYIKVKPEEREQPHYVKDAKEKNPGADKHVGETIGEPGEAIIDQYADDVIACALQLATKWDIFPGDKKEKIAEIFTRLSDFEPLVPLQGTDDEWSDATYGDSRQNTRCSSVFKHKDGKAHYIHAVVFVEPNGAAFTGALNADIRSSLPVTFPFMPKTFYVHVTEDYKLVDPKEWEEAVAYYKKMLY
jgi:hypothetical protein